MGSDEDGGGVGARFGDSKRGVSFFPQSGGGDGTWTYHTLQTTCYTPHTTHYIPTLVLRITSPHLTSPHLYHLTSPHLTHLTPPHHDTDEEELSPRSLSTRVSFFSEPTLGAPAPREMEWEPGMYSPTSAEMDRKTYVKPGEAPRPPPGPAPPENRMIIPNPA